MKKIYNLKNIMKVYVKKYWEFISGWKDIWLICIFSNKKLDNDNKLLEFFEKTLQDFWTFFYCVSLNKSQLENNMDHISVTVYLENNDDEKILWRKMCNEFWDEDISQHVFTFFNFAKDQNIKNVEIYLDNELYCQDFFYTFIQEINTIESLYDINLEIFF